MRRILTILMALPILLIATSPILADTNQKAELNGGNAAVVKVTQIAWNLGSGDINQNVDVRVAGNYQKIDQDSLVIISDGYEGNINNTINGINLIKVDLDQYSMNTGSGKISQGIEVAVEGNIQVLDQGILIIE
ncbi:Uncharacterised protein [uncultured archaeon]|nr:Uncharacterised protein [uncultured archaeon]